MNVFFTICARNYLGFAFSLADSVRQCHPDCEFHVFLLDGDDLPFHPSGVRVRPIADCLPQEELDHLRLRYTILEYATAVKPWCFAALFRENAATAVYIDPDIHVFQPMTEVFDLLAGPQHGVVTPHLLAPLPRDGKKPDDLSILQSGIYNLGFLALSRCEASAALVAWWQSWLKTHCYADPATGVFTDQKWMNFAPLFFPGVAILRHPGYNVAYWNLPNRSVEWVGEQCLVDGQPLVFFHYSGFDPQSGEVLSRHENRYGSSVPAAVRRLLDFYRLRLEKFSYAAYRAMAYRAPRFASGWKFDAVSRQGYLQAEKDGLVFSRPLAAGSGSFLEWLLAPVSKQGAADVRPVSRYLELLWAMRKDLPQAFPDIFEKDHDRFVEWARSRAVTEMGCDPDLLQQAIEGCATQQSAAIGVNYVGYVETCMGLGEAARGYIKALIAAGVQVHVVDISDMAALHARSAAYSAQFASTGRHPVYDVNIFHCNADMLPDVLSKLPPDFCAGRLNVGIWAWETTEFPAQWRDRFDLLDEIWVGSRFMAEALSPHSPVPVLCIPHVVDAPRLAGNRGEFGIAADEFVFLFCFDFLSIAKRKNPQGVVESFIKAFLPTDPVRLLIKSLNGDKCPADLQLLQASMRDHRVTILDKDLDSAARYRLLASCDAFVSLHRAEGFGLLLAEAMALGKPVIATGWSGNMDFMNIANSYPVSFEIKPLDDDYPPYRAGTLWAEPDIAHAAQCMRRVFENADEALLKGSRAQSDMAKYFGAAKVGEMMAGRIQESLCARKIESVEAMVEETLREQSVGEAETPPRAFSLSRYLWRIVFAATPGRFQPYLARVTHALLGRS